MDPVFQTLDELKASLRLNGICDGSSSMPIFLDAIEGSRLEMVHAFGVAQFEIYKALGAPPADPVTEEDYKQVTLKRLEIQLVESILCWRLRTIYSSSSADRNEEFESIADFRNMDPDMQEERCKRSWKAVQDLFGKIGVLDTYRPSGTVQMMTIGPECTPPLVIGMGSRVSPATCGGDMRPSRVGGPFGLSCS